MKKIIVPILLFICILTGCNQESCNQENEKYSLLFTSDIAYGKDISYFVTYTDNGTISNRTQINGALHYNIIKSNDKLLFNNGKNLITITDDIVEEKILDKKPLGYLEKKSYFIYKNQPVFIYNVGFNKKNIYESMIQLNKNDKVYFKGFVESFWVKNKYFYALVSSYDNLSENMYITKVNLDSGKIENEQKIDLKKENNIAISGIKTRVINDKVFVLKELLSDEPNKISGRKIVTISLNNFSICESDIEGISLKDKITYDSFFEFKDRIYFVANNQIFHFLNEDVNSVKKTSIALPKEFGESIIITENKNKLYLLEAGSEPYILEVDLIKKEISKPIKLDKPNYLKNMTVTSFVVE